MEEGNLNGDPGIGTLTTNASPMNTLATRHAGDDSGTGSLDGTPENTQKRAPPIPSVPPPTRKPLKPHRRRASAQSAGSLDTSEDPQRKSLYDNLSASSGPNDPEACSNSSMNAVAGSVDSLDSRRLSSELSRSGHPTPERSQISPHKKPLSRQADEEVHSRPLPPGLRPHSGSESVSPHRSVQDSSIQHLRTSSCPTTKTAAAPSLGDTGRKRDRLSPDESSISSHPIIPPKPQLRMRKSHDNQVR